MSKRNLGALGPLEVACTGANGDRFCSPASRSMWRSSRDWRCLSG